MTTRRQSSEDSSTLALSTDMTFFRRLRAASKATFAMRTISGVVYTSVLTPRSPSAVFSMPLGLPK